MVRMYICICNAITERQVKEAVDNGVSTMSDLQAQLGVATCCGACADTAVEYLPGGQYASEGSMFATPIARQPETVEMAANESQLRPARTVSYATLS